MEVFHTQRYAAYFGLVESFSSSKAETINGKKQDKLIEKNNGRWLNQDDTDNERHSEKEWILCCKCDRAITSTDLGALSYNPLFTINLQGSRHSLLGRTNETISPSYTGLQY